MDNGSVTLKKQVKLLLFLSFIFLTILYLQDMVLITKTKGYLMAEFEKRLTLQGEIIAREVGEHLTEAMEDQYYLYNLSQIHSVKRILLLDEGQGVIIDSSGEFKKGVRVEPKGIKPEEFQGIWSGKRLASLPYADGTGKSLSFYLPLYNSEGEVIAILDLKSTMPFLERIEAGSLTFKTIRFSWFLAAGVLLYYIIRSLISAQKVYISSTTAASRQEDGSKNNTGFVIDTFHNLIQRLKEKEQELERLKNQAEDRAEITTIYNEDILRSINSGVITFDREGKIITMNHAAEGILGFSREVLIGKNSSEAFGHDNRINQLLQATLSKEEAPKRQEFEFRRGNEKIWVGLSASLLGDRENKVMGAIFVFTDLTEIKRLQDQVELRKRLSLLGEMSAGIAHEFRNQMGTILGFARLLSKKLPDDDGRQEIIGAIIGELALMEKLISELLSFSKPVGLNLQPTDLDKLLRRLLLQTLADAGETKPKIDLEIDEGLPMVSADETTLAQAFVNLFQNSLEAMPNGGELRVSARYRDGGVGKSSVEIEISDTGVGIPEEKKDKVFLPFFTTKPKGTGLGLALVQKIILSHNGKIELDSEEGKGTTFRIYLPCTSTGIRR